MRSVIHTSALTTWGGFWLALATLGLWPRLWDHAGLWGSWLGVLALTLITLIIVIMRHAPACRAGAPPLSVIGAMRKRQPIQQLAQVMIYIGIAVHWPRMTEQLPLTLAQVAFAFSIDMLWVWWRGHSQYRISLSPTPIILSLNLFLWFRDEVFYWQWVLVAFAVLSRALLTWERPINARGETRRVNMFNPSAITIAITGVVLILTQSTHLTWGEELAVRHGEGDVAYIVIFAAGLLAQNLAPIGWVTLGGTLGYLGVDWVYAYLGQDQYTYQFIDTAIPPAVFLGLNLLITDPATIPRSRFGQLLYGLAYAGMSFMIFGWLQEMSVGATVTTASFNPTFLDKALAIPALNLSVRLIDRVIKPPEKMIGGLWHQRLGWSMGWSACFVLIVSPRLEEHPGRDLNFWESRCEHSLSVVTQERAQERAQESSSRIPTEPPATCQVRDHLWSLICDRGELSLCHNLALSPITSSKRALSLLEQACEGGATHSCLALGAQLDQVRMGETDTGQRASLDERAERAWRRGCLVSSPKVTLNSIDHDGPSTFVGDHDLHSVESQRESCVHLASISSRRSLAKETLKLTPHFSELKQVTTPQLDPTLDLLSYACYLGSEAGCLALARESLKLGVKLERSDDIRDHMLGYHYRSQAVIASQRLCPDERDEPVEVKVSAVKVDQASSHRGAACWIRAQLAATETSATKMSGQVYQDTSHSLSDSPLSQTHRVISWLKTACADSIKLACFALGEESFGLAMRLGRTHQRTPELLNQAQRAWSRLCPSLDAPLPTQVHDLNELQQLSGHSCERLARLSSLGGAASDRGLTFQFLDRACKLGVPRACSALRSAPASVRREER